MTPGTLAEVKDPTADLKAKARETWALGDYDSISVLTTPPAAHLVRFARVRAGQALLDVATGTGVVAITARRAGARVTALDLTPELLERARDHARIAGTDDIVWQAGDAEAMPFADASFDVVVSQMGHMFTPRPEAVTRELLRVLRPGGTLAFTTWPPEQFVGRMFTLNGRFVPAPSGSAPPPQWGNVDTILQRLGSAVVDTTFERGVMQVPALSPAHVRQLYERYYGPTLRVVAALKGDPARLAEWRRAYEDLIGEYFVDNIVRSEFLMTRGRKA